MQRMLPIVNSIKSSFCKNIIFCMFFFPTFFFYLLHFPRFSVVLIYYAFNLALMMIVRPMLSYKFCKNLGRSSIYAALYFHPILVVFHAVFSGLVCKYHVFFLCSILSFLSVSSHAQ